MAVITSVMTQQSVDLEKDTSVRVERSGLAKVTRCRCRRYSSIRANCSAVLIKPCHHLATTVRSLTGDRRAARNRNLNGKMQFRLNGESRGVKSFTSFHDASSCSRAENSASIRATLANFRGSRATFILRRACIARFNELGGEEPTELFPRN